MGRKEPPGPPSPPYRARCSGCLLTWDVGRPFAHAMYGAPHEGCHLNGRWVPTRREVERHRAAEHTDGLPCPEGALPSGGER